MERIKVLVVDDSAFARHILTRQLKTDPQLEVIGHARDGIEAIAKVAELRPDVVTLDIEMPRMDGLTALKTIMMETPTPVVMFSTLTGKGTDATIRALELGAVDFFLKISPTNPTGMEGPGELIAKLKMASRVRLNNLRYTPLPKATSIKDKAAAGKGGVPHEVIVIGSSTGGPRALYQLVPALPAEMSAAVLIVQHMPPGFTASLANRLDQLSYIAVKEAEAGDVLRQGQAYLAPGGYHMVVNRRGIIDLNKAPTVCGVRPAIDVTMDSVVAVYRESIIGVILTGMGSDGTHGSGLAKAAGGLIIAEDESTCTIYGMPKSVADAGYADYVYPLPRIAEELVKLTESRMLVKR